MMLPQMPYQSKTSPGVPKWQLTANCPTATAVTTPTSVDGSLHSVDVESLRQLQTSQGTRLLDIAVTMLAEGKDDLTVGSLLRRTYPASLVAAALSQVQLRAAGQKKFGSLAGRMFFTRDGLEQASRREVASRRAARFAEAGVPRILDLCCGIGGDLIALTNAGLFAHGVDRDELTSAIAEANLQALSLSGRAQVTRADVTKIPLEGWPAAFIDPARRIGGRRLADPASYSPSFDVVQTLMRDIPLTCAKLAPIFPHDLLPSDAEAEWTSVRGEVVELSLWQGDIGTVRRRATLLPSGASLIETGAATPATGAIGEWLYEPDGAVIRAHLISEVAAAIGGRLLDATIAYLTTDRRSDTVFARTYQVTDVLPFSVKRLRSLLRARHVGSVTVKKRGSAVDPETLRRQLRLSGDSHATIVLTRQAGAPTVLLVEPFTSVHSSEHIGSE